MLDGCLMCVRGFKGNLVVSTCSFAINMDAVLVTVVLKTAVPTSSGHMSVIDPSPSCFSGQIEMLLALSMVLHGLKACGAKFILQPTCLPSSPSSPTNCLLNYLPLVPLMKWWTGRKLLSSQHS